jgi:hypothetical protein
MMAALVSPATAEDAPKFFTAISPIFGQLVAFSQPASFVPAYEKADGSNYIREVVPKGETVDQWSQMITVTGVKELAMTREVYPITVTSTIANGFKKSCPKTFAAMSVPPPDIPGYRSFAAVVGCGSVAAADGTQRSEAALIIAVKGEADYYTLQWAERGKATGQPFAIDKLVWERRLKDLGPIRLCPIITGEKAPFPSCLGH